MLTNSWKLVNVNCVEPGSPARLAESLGNVTGQILENRLSRTLRTFVFCLLEDETVEILSWWCRDVFLISSKLFKALITYSCAEQ